MLDVRYTAPSNVELLCTHLQAANGCTSAFAQHQGAAQQQSMGDIAAKEVLQVPFFCAAQNTACQIWPFDCSSIIQALCQ